MDVFGLAVQSASALCDAAMAAGHELRVFDALAHHGRSSIDELASAIGVSAGRHRLRALLDVLAVIGAIHCDRSGTPRFAAATVTPPHPVIARDGWGRLADIIRTARPLSLDDVESERRFHHHLAEAGAAAARELVPHLGDTTLLDLGAGAGAYSKAFLQEHPTARATLVDSRDVLALAHEGLGPFAERAEFVEGDASSVDAGDGYGAALLANVLHLHSADMCARLCSAAARAVEPGGVVVIKDLRVDEDRSGPLAGVLFALNMAVYTEAGDVYPTSQLRAWLSEAGLVEIVEHRLVAAPDAVVVIGRRPWGRSGERAHQGAAWADRA